MILGALKALQVKGTDFAIHKRLKEFLETAGRENLSRRQPRLKGMENGNTIKKVVSVSSAEKGTRAKKGKNGFHPPKSDVLTNVRI
jgi:hypothetical protein